MSNETTTIEIEQTLSKKFEVLDTASKKSTAELWKRSDIAEIVRRALEGSATLTVGGEPYQILSVIRDVIWLGIPVRIATRRVVDTIGKCVAKSGQDVATASSDSHTNIEGTTEMDEGNRKRADVAALLDLPSLKEAVRAVVEHQRISSDPADRFREQKIVDGRGGFSLEIPRHQH